MRDGPDPGSFRDPSSVVVHLNDVVYRRLRADYREHYDALMKSGLYEEATAAGLLVPHEEISADCLGMSGDDVVIRPARVPFISYPYEWCFSQLRDAALATLEIQRRALNHGLTLKDASAFNIQFVRGRPMLIDTASFARCREGEPWIGYRQFCQHFLAPLTVMATRDVRLGWLTSQLDGLPLDLASRLLPRSTWFRFGCLLHVHLHARSIRRFAHTPLRASKLNRPITRRALFGLIDSLTSTVERLRWTPAGTEWSDYTADTSYERSAAETKAGLVRDLIARVGPRVVWDLGANTGRFSQIAAETGALVIALDVDRGAVEKHYLGVRRRGETRILPLVVDITNPSPAVGWAHAERRSLIARGEADLVLALALIHHLAISNNVPLAHLARFFADSGRHLIVEFVPKSDIRVRRLLGSREDVFPTYTPAGFEAAFEPVFRVLDKVAIAGSERSLYLFERRQP